MSQIYTTIDSQMAQIKAGTKTLRNSTNKLKNQSPWLSIFETLLYLLKVYLIFIIKFRIALIIILKKFNLFNVSSYFDLIYID